MIQKINNNGAPKYLVIFLLIVSIFVAGFYVGKIDLFKNVELNPEKYQITGDKLTERNNVDVGLLWEVWSEIEQEYIDTKNIDGQDLLYGAVDGLVKGLDDQYTNFLTPEETKEYLSGNKREFEGIGTTLAQEGEFVVIESPIDGSPAQQAGLKPKDVILRVNEEDMQGKSVIEVAKNIRGEANSKVMITYYRADNNETKDVEIIRQKIDLKNIEVIDLENGIKILKIYQFTEADVETFNREWDSNISQLIQDNPKGLIVDLRNNPGGFVDAVRYSVGEFLPKGAVVFQEEDKSGRKTQYKVNRDGKLLDIPMVIIVNEGSASSSEIFAGAMQDNDRAEVVGTKTVGKGVEQKLINLSDGSMLQIVFQKWLTSNGRHINEEDPITPDHAADDTEAQDQKAIDLLLSK
ncbi:S41 family peptidase [Candidatus Dojkabacteria bacterium]|uniref:S41 family peptidase n=1 Tax=Candidatus Dojkabacteria bacterium TaxID=2099670 RepID=A0A955I826_9BACT|nr:S41 family peptidase [Candidatus Dojkabacteria bacterium]